MLRIKEILVMSICTLFVTAYTYCHVPIGTKLVRAGVGRYGTICDRTVCWRSVVAVACVVVVGLFKSRSLPLHEGFQLTPA